MAGTPAPQTILVVEDDAEAREVMVEHLALHGFTIFEATSGVEAFLHLKRAPPEAVVLNLNMNHVLLEEQHEEHGGQRSQEAPGCQARLAVVA